MRTAPTTDIIWIADCAGAIPEHRATSPWTVAAEWASEVCAYDEIDDVLAAGPVTPASTWHTIADYNAGCLLGVGGEKLLWIGGDPTDHAA